MKIRYDGPLLIVADVEAAKHFYETVLGQTVIYHKENKMVKFEVGLSLISTISFEEWMDDDVKKIFSLSHSSHHFELYFEVDDIVACYEKLRLKPEILWLHGPSENENEQMSMRFYDLDGHVIEIGEAIAATAKRLAAKGIPTSEISAKFSEMMWKGSRLY